MTYEEAVQSIPCGRYRHFKGKPYEVIGIARHSETEEPMVVYRALYGEGGLWTRPASMWNEEVTRDGKTYRRAVFLCGGDGSGKRSDGQLQSVLDAKSGLQWQGLCL